MNLPERGRCRMRMPGKLLLVMRITTAIMFLTAFHVSANGISQTVSYTGKQVRLEQVFSVIEQQTGYGFFYKLPDLSSAKPVSVDLKNVPLRKALSKVLQNQSLNFTIEGNTIFITLKAPAITLPPELTVVTIPPPPVNVHGIVKDETGKTVAGALVKVKGTDRATTTNESGEFFLKEVDEKCTLFISAVNIETKEVVLHGKTDVVINVKIKVNELENVGVTVVSNGYQTLPKERSAGSFAKPDMTIVGNRSGSMNILQRLDGLIPGLTINNAPGQTPYLIRGLTTVSISPAPLYVVDGIPLADVSSINPQDIADITVLKDATAASIWGSRAANGVIVIVSKKGTKGEKIKITYDAFANLQGKPDINYFPVLNSRQFIQAAKETFDPVAYPYATVSTYPTSSAGLAPHEVILYNQFLGNITAAQANNSLDSLGSINNNGQIKDLWYRNAMLMNHTLSISGGQKNYSIYGSVSYTDTRTNGPGQSNNLFKINLRQDFNVGKRIQLTLITDLLNNFTNSPRNITVTDQFYPYQLFQDKTGKNLSMPYMTALSDATRTDYETRSRISLDYNPLNEVNHGYTKNDAQSMRNILGVNIKLTNYLSFEGNYGYLKGATRTRDFDDAQSFTVRAQTVQYTVAPTAASTPVYYMPTTGGNYAVTNLNQRNWTIRNQLNFNKNWQNRLHQLTILAGQEAQELYTVTNVSRVKGWDPLLQTGTLVDYKALAAGIAGVVWSNYVSGYSLLTDGYFAQSEVQSRFTSYYANVAYTFNRKYAVNGSYRIDKSNNFGIDKAAQNKPIWSAGGKWLISEEDFLKPVSWLNSLAIRATYGLTGNAPNPGTAASYDIVSVSSSTFLPNSRGLQVSTPANRKLTWESTATINLGVDFSVLKNRLSGAIDVYRKKTSDLLGNVPIDGFTGYASIFGNLGDLENKGVELSLNSVNISSGKFNWSTQLNLAYNKNKITSLNILSTPVTTGNVMVTQQFVAGYAGYSVFAYQFAKLDNLGDPQIRLADGTVSKTPNVSKPGDIKYMGTSQPVWSGGLSNNFSYKSFGLSFNVIFNLGHVMRRDVNNFYSGRLTHFNTSNGFASGNINADFVNRWKQPGDELTTNIPSFVSSATVSPTRRDINYYTLADINVVSASFIKMRDITLTYSLPQFIMKKINTDAITFRAQLSNLMLWKANKNGIDPEFQYATTGTRAMPVNQRTITFGINVRL